jgi:DNA modification methylase
MRADVVRANARALPLADDCVDLVVTSPPYFALRSYQDGGEHYAGQIGDEPTPAAFVDSLLEVTRECMRVLKPSGSVWVNLGDKYSGAQAQNFGGVSRAGASEDVWKRTDPRRTGIPNKSLMGIPWRYALRCIDDLGLILRAEVIWSKPNGLPESVTDRVRRSHEQWFHFTLNPRYYSAVDEIREQYDAKTAQRYAAGYGTKRKLSVEQLSKNTDYYVDDLTPNPLGKLPGSVWEIATEPLKVPESLGVDHFAAFPTEFPRRIIQGWSPAGVCTACGEGRRPVVVKEFTETGRKQSMKRQWQTLTDDGVRAQGMGAGVMGTTAATITGYACACPEPTSPTTPAVVLDPFGGTGTTALVAKALGRRGISVDMSADYCRLARWRVSDPGQVAKAMRVAKPAPQVEGQASLFDAM